MSGLTSPWQGAYMDGVMRVELRLLAALKRLLPDADRDKGAVTFELGYGATVSSLLLMAGVDMGKTLVVLRNGRGASPEDMLAEGDVVSVFPPVAGG